MSVRPRILIAEDEDLARDRLVRLIQERSHLDLVAVCRNGNETAAAFDANDIDIALLDIQMPGVDGMTLARNIDDADEKPLIVFVTAYPSFAVDAFAEQAVDYLLKPFDAARLDRVLDAATQRLHADAALAASRRPHYRADERSVARRLLVADNGRLIPLRERQIRWISAEGRHCTIHTQEKSYRCAGPLSQLLLRLGETPFVRISRSTVVNMEFVRELQPLFKGELIVVLSDGTELPVSRRLRAQVVSALGGGDDMDAN